VPHTFRSRYGIAASARHHLNMNSQTSKALALLGGVATLALGSTFMLRLTPPKAKPPLAPCAPRMLELEKSVCEPLGQKRSSVDGVVALGVSH
jgi:hypothetical protein